MGFWHQGAPHDYWGIVSLTSSCCSEASFAAVSFSLLGAQRASKNNQCFIRGVANLPTPVMLDDSSLPLTEGKAVKKRRPKAEDSWWHRTGRCHPSSTWEQYYLTFTKAHSVVLLRSANFQRCAQLWAVCLPQYSHPSPFQDAVSMLWTMTTCCHCFPREWEEGQLFWRSTGNFSRPRRLWAPGKICS